MHQFFIITLLLPVLSMLLSFFPHAIVQRPNCEDQTLSLIDPTWRCGDAPLHKKQEYDLLQQDLMKRIDTWIVQGKATRISMYFRDLDNGPFFGINGQEYLIPESLVKLPVLIGLLKEAESDPSVLDAAIGVTELPPPSKNVRQSSTMLRAQTMYTVREVMKNMISNSDFPSAELLKHHVDVHYPDLLKKTYEDLGIALVDVGGGEKVMTLKS